jgi:poly-gamma-glutamate capsule biosynthesis protein CapA/YwtB (metallophosphatase superfamily)
MKPRLNYGLILAATASFFLLSIAAFFLFRDTFFVTPVLSIDVEKDQMAQANALSNEEYLNATFATSTSNIFPAVTFTGDIMLARSVELLMTRNGGNFPFAHIPELAASSSAFISNFEAAIPLEHIPTPPYAMRFSVDKKYIEALHVSGVTHVSLANNHSLDYGQSAYTNTRQILQQNNIVSFGHSTTLSTSSITYIKAGSTTVSILAIHTLFVAPNPIVLSNLANYMKKTSDVQLAYVHWGTEYKNTHDTTQDALAKYLVTLGIDGIIGHHPHVVEDIQLIGTVPVFYSLGNFIFDQYFSTPVQQGLVIRLSFSNDSLTFNLIPVTSIDSHGQPRLMNETEKATFLANLAAKSAPTLSESIKTGKVISPLPLVKTVEDSMI